jgi:methionine-S-sulfoxide reductase
MSHQHRHTAFFAAGCFWGVQDYFDHIPGVLETEVGYSGGTLADPTYEDVISEKTGHAETVKIVFDPMRVSYYDLVRQFFRMHDPTQLNRQNYDIGPSYRSAIFYVDASQQKIAELMKTQLETQKQFDKPIMTEITAAGPFYLAEAYHQKFTKKTGRGACPVPYAPLS